MDVRGRGLQAQGDEVALPHRRVHARVAVGEGRPSAPSDPTRDRALRDFSRSRGAVEREFGRLKHEWALLPLRTRGIERVRLHADLTILLPQARVRRPESTGDDAHVEQHDPMAASDPQAKLERADKHIRELARMIRAFREKAYSVSVQPAMWVEPPTQQNAMQVVIRAEAAEDPVAGVGADHRRHRLQPAIRTRPARVGAQRRSSSHAREASAARPDPAS